MDPSRGWLFPEECYKKRCLYCLTSDGLIIYLRVIQGHSGGIKVDLALLDNEKIFTDGASAFTTSVAPAQSRLIAGGKDAKEGRQAVFFTALDPMNDVPEEEIMYQKTSNPRRPSQIFFFERSFAGPTR